MKTLLIVADDWEALERYEDALSVAFKIETAPFGSIGLERAAEAAPNAILIDLDFEDMSNDEFIQGLKDRNLSQIPVLQIKRPFTYPDLIERIRALIS